MADSAGPIDPSQLESSVEPIELFRRGLASARDTLARVPEDGWDAASPCEGWTVRDVANHLANECAWVPDLMAGKTIAQVGDAYDGDLLGTDPVASFAVLSQAALTAFESDPGLATIVHLSFGDVPASVYVTQLGFDHVVHGWDIARGAGIEDGVDDELAHAAHAAIAPMMGPEIRGTIFAEEQPAPAGASAIEALAAFTGRRA